MKAKKKRAFTLTELLIVVIVIGVLSAVVLPKFNKIIETRKTTEAEEVLAAVRTEQEQRCSLHKRYTDDFSKLTNVIASNTTKNYTYSISNTTANDGTLQSGAAATSKGSYNYTLRMPSFADGRICCDTQANGSQCDKLNKDYPACSELIARADYTKTETQCRLPCNPTSGNSYTQSCGDGFTGIKTFTWNGENCSYDMTDTCVCAPTSGASINVCESPKTGRTCAWSTATCDYTICSGTCSCSAPAGNSKDICTGGRHGRTCNWDPDSCSYRDANDNCTGTCVFTCDLSNRPAESESCSDGINSNACGNPPTRTRTVTCDPNTGNWQIGNWGGCTAGGCKYGNNHCANVGDWVAAGPYCVYVGSRRNVPHTRSTLLTAKPKDDFHVSFQYAAAGYYCDLTQQMGCYTSDPHLCYGTSYSDYILPQDLGQAKRRCLPSGELESYATSGCAYFGACMGEFEVN